jgi:O-antigen ligase
MIEPYYPTTEQLLANRRVRGTRLLIIVLVLLTIVLGSMIATYLLLKSPSPVTVVAIPCIIVVVTFIPIAIWINPRNGFYLSLICFTVFGGDIRNIVSKIPTAYVPIFLPVNNIGEYFGTTALDAIKFDPFELLILVTFTFWLIQAIVRRDQVFKPGAFLVPILVYLAFVTFGIGNGLASGGDANFSLQETRVQFTCLLVYILTTQMITDRKQIQTVLWYLVVGIGIRSLLGLASYLMLQGNISDQGILEHEDSLIMDILFFIPVLLVITGGPKKLIHAALIFIPTALLTEIENNRRAGIAAFVLAFIILLPMVWVLLEKRRRQVLVFITVATMFSVVYLPLAWNSNATWAMPARALRSDSDPNSRDAASNLYRIQEDTDLKYTRDLNPLIGYGCGKRWVQIIPLAHVSTDYMYYIAHDSVLWLWMSLGHIGFFSFMMLIAAVLVRGTHICKQIRDPILLTTCILAILLTLMTFVYAKFDVQLFDMRVMGLLFVLIALLGNMPQIAGIATVTASRTDTDPEDATQEDLALPLGDSL